MPLISKRAHNRVVSVLHDQLESNARDMADLTRRALDAERNAHMIVEQLRYTLQAASRGTRAEDKLSGLAHVLPYVLSGRRHWAEPAGVSDGARMKDEARLLARDYGYELPEDPVLAVLSLLDVAALLLNPGAAYLLEGLRNLYPTRT
ncbi:hypothetical protein WT12_08350 [Burkholderia territorii]|uniref:hypothetical protein n=1 Tax=Burkholderia territorii TaxID=1503055 RepID=UPI000753F515|nr:hypothetical protein [Burkholderia territorii]KVN48747.1 hypothetical protein WT12_08350 [Burkholderia territorii]